MTLTREEAINRIEKCYEALVFRGEGVGKILDLMLLEARLEQTIKVSTFTFASDFNDEINRLERQVAELKARK